MLFPAIVLDLSAAEADLLRNHLDAFAELGFEAEPFGGNTFKISAVPANLYSVASVDLLDALLDELLTLENPYNCPHGRPTIISISRYEMDKKFKRIV